MVEKSKAFGSLFRGRSSLWGTSLVIVMLAIGVYFLLGGIWLTVLGGSPFYVLSGGFLLGTAWLLYKKSAYALLVYATLLLVTLVWALFERGLDFWSLVPRLDILGPLGLVLLLYVATGSLRAPVRVPMMFLSGTVVVGLAVLMVSTLHDPYDVAGTIDRPPVESVGPVASKDWTAWGGSGLGNHYSALTQITAENVKHLKLAWEFRTGDFRVASDSGETTNEATPLKIGNVLYTCSAHQIVFALDAATGRLKWKYDPHIVSRPEFQHLTCRGVSYHETKPGATTIDGVPAPQDCPERIFLPTNDARMIALDAETGKPCESFGQHGEISLKEYEDVTIPGFYEGTSPPVVTDQVLIMGGCVIDNWSTHEPSGAIRGFDIYTGKLLWAFDASNPDPNEMPSATHHFTPSSPNSWAVSAVDENLGLVYVPLGTQDPDIWGGNRTVASERYDSSLVALDVKTGKLRWSYQNVHHDLWDMDLPSQPALVDVTTAAGKVPAIYIPAKTGNIFVLDRRNGHLIVPAPETKVPQGAAPGDHLSPTQPFSDLSFRPRAILTDADMWGATSFDQLMCRIIFKRLRYEGPFTPPSTQGTLAYPGDVGMFEWGGVGIDPGRQIMIANPTSIPFVQRLVPRGPNNPAQPGATLPAGSETGVQPMFGTPFGVNLNVFLSPLGLPCMAPPWGTIAAVDLKTHKIVWQHRIGTIQDSSPVPLPIKVGTPMLGGPLVTAGGLAFLSSTLDDYIRAFDVRTGKMVWQDRLPAGGQSDPMSYEADGRQFIVTTDGGHQTFGTKMGDYIRAYTLQ